MKYIRTKDGVYKVVFVSPLGFVRIDKRDGTYPDVFEKDILKQADTIKELCDKCVVIHKYEEQPKDMSFYDAQYFIDVWTRKVKSNDPIVAIYGAIWTDKGLIYVAKMNDKGELELL